MSLPPDSQKVIDAAGKTMGNETESLVKHNRAWLMWAGAAAVVAVVAWVILRLLAH